MMADRCVCGCGGGGLAYALRGWSGRRDKGTSRLVDGAKEEAEAKYGGH